MVDAVVSYNNMISRKHCTVMKENGIYQIEDEGSSNGTYVNGARLMPHILGNDKTGRYYKNGEQ